MKWEDIYFTKTVPQHSGGQEQVLRFGLRLHWISNGIIAAQTELVPSGGFRCLPGACGHLSIGPTGYMPITGSTSIFAHSLLLITGEDSIWLERALMRCVQA